MFRVLAATESNGLPAAAAAVEEARMAESDRGARYYEGRCITHYCGGQSRDSHCVKNCMREVYGYKG